MGKNLGLYHLPLHLNTFSSLNSFSRSEDVSLHLLSDCDSTVDEAEKHPDRSSAHHYPMKKPMFKNTSVCGQCTDMLKFYYNSRAAAK